MTAPQTTEYIVDIFLTRLVKRNKQQNRASKVVHHSHLLLSFFLHRSLHPSIFHMKQCHTLHDVNYTDQQENLLTIKLNENSTLQNIYRHAS